MKDVLDKEHVPAPPRCEDSLAPGFVRLLHAQWIFVVVASARAAPVGTV